MRRLAKALLIVVTGFAIVFAGSGVALAAAVAATGIVTVQVEDSSDGTDFSVPLPALAIDLGLGIASLVVPAEELAELRRAAAPAVPALEAIADDLSEMPNATLVEFHDQDEMVTVVKRGRSLVINVDADDTDIQISIPIRSVHRLTNFLAG